MQKNCSLPCLLFSFGAAHFQPHLFSGGHVIQEIPHTPSFLIMHPPEGGLEPLGEDGCLGQSEFAFAVWIMKKKADPSSLFPGADLPQGSFLTEAPVPPQSTRWRQSANTMTLPFAVSLFKEPEGPD